MTGIRAGSNKSATVWIWPCVLVNTWWNSSWELSTDGVSAKKCKTCAKRCLTLLKSAKRKKRQVLNTWVGRRTYKCGSAHVLVSNSLRLHQITFPQFLRCVLQALPCFCTRRISYSTSTRGNNIIPQTLGWPLQKTLNIFSDHLNTSLVVCKPALSNVLVSCWNG